MTATTGEFLTNRLSAESCVTAPAVPVEKVRDQTIDVLRGLAIVGVVYVHGCWLLTRGLAPAIPLDWFRYDVGAFIAIAAYLTCRSSQRLGMPYWSAVGKRWTRLWFPFIVWSLVYLACAPEWWTLSPEKLLTGHFLGYGWSGQYYFLILFQLAFLQPFFKRVNISTGALLAVFAASAAWLVLLHCRIPGSAFALKLAERPVLYWAPFVALGIWLARNHEAFESRLARVPSPVILSFCLLASCAPLLQDRYFPQDQVTRTLVHLRSSNLIGSTAVFLGAWTLVRRGALGSLAVPLRIMGRYVLGIFCLNPLVIMALQRVFGASGMDHRLPWWAASVSFAIVVPLILLISLACSIAIERAGGRRLVK